MLKPNPDAKLTLELPELTTSSVAHPDTWNPTHQALLDNDAALARAASQLADEFHQSQGDIAQQLGELQSLDAPQLASAVRLDWEYGGNQTSLELWSGEYSMMDATPVAVLSAIAGDDSVDVENASQFKPGSSYVIYDGAHAEAVTVQTVLTGNRIRLRENLQRDYGAGALLSSTSLTLSSTSAQARDGDVYFSGRLRLSQDAAKRAAVVRTGGGPLVKVDYMTASGQWAAAPLAWTRTGGKIPTGQVDCEYEFTHGGETALRVTVSGEGEIAHIALLGKPTGLGGVHTPPLKPRMANPLDGATGLTDRPTFALTGYASPAHSPVAVVQFQVSETEDFAEPIIDSGAHMGGLSWREVGLRLKESSSYFARGRAQDVEGAWSPWSDSTSFSTSDSFVYIQAPDNLAPASGLTDVSDTPTLSSSAFAVYAGEDEHASTQWQIRRAGEGYDDAVLDTGDDTENLTALTIPAELLESGGADYYWRVRHKGAEIGYGDWSVETRFTTKKAFGTIIGIALVTPGGASGQWARIDGDGNAKQTDAAFFNAHPTYAGIVEQLIDSQHMMKVPAFYVKEGFLESGTFVGKHAILISDKKEAGFELHPAFYEAGMPLEQFWLGKYKASNGAGNVMQSLPGASPLVNINFPTMVARAVARNAGGVTGFQLWHVHMRAAVQTLALIELGNPDVQTLVAPGHSSSSAAQAVDAAATLAASWRGIVGLWGNVWEMFDGLQTDGNRMYRIWDRQGNKQFLQTNQLAPAANAQYIVTMSTESGDGYRLGEAFLPASVDPSINNGTYSDGFWSNANCVAYHGGSWDNGAHAGLFCLNVNNAASRSYTSFGGRLAKV